MKKVLLFLILFVSFSFANLKIVKAETYPFTGQIVSGTLVVHSAANYSDSSAMEEIAYGTKVKVLKAVSNSAGNFYQIEYENKSGYVAKSYVINYDDSIKTDNSNVNGIESYSNYCNTLMNQGFPNSYCPYLYKLHEKYPRWQFVVDPIGQTLSDAAASETGKVVLQTDNQNYWYSSKPIEGSYYYIKTDVIAAFMDPRNSLNEKYVFQFLDYISSYNIYDNTSLGKIASGGNLSKYYDEYKSAAEKNKVNPLHLMGRSKQEGANKSTYNAVTGTYTRDVGTDYNGMSLDGFYNFYNIGAYNGNGLTPVARGLAYGAGYLESKNCYVYSGGKYVFDKNTCGDLSYERPWTSPAAAISGGAAFIVNDYISRAQNTGYYQKFNVSSNHYYSLYTHQYMTNIYAPASEASIIFNAYNSTNLIYSNFKFIIPVYKNMGNDPVAPLNKDSDASLSGIYINDSLISGFDSDVVEYQANVVTTASSINVTASPTRNTSKVSGTGKYNFNDGSVNVKLTVTAEDGTIKTYNILVKQVSAGSVISVSQIVNKMDVRVNGTNMYGISPGTLVSTLINTVAKSGGTATVKNSSNTVKSSGSLVTGDKIVINGTTDSVTYYVAIRGDANGDGKVTIVDLLLLQKHILNKGSLSGIKFYAGDANYDGKVTIVDLLLLQKHILGKGNL